MAEEIFDSSNDWVAAHIAPTKTRTSPIALFQPVLAQGAQTHPH